MRNAYALYLVVALAFGCLPSQADAELQKYEFEISSDAVTARTTSDSLETSCYTISLNIPDAVKTGKLLSAVLEFYVNVSAAPIDGWMNDSPVVELYALNTAVGEGVDVSTFRMPSAAVRTVRIGQGRRIALNVTDILRGWIEDSESNHTVALGSFRGDREALLTLNENGFGQRVIARLICLCQVAD